MLRDVNDVQDDETFFVCGGVGVLCVTREFREEEERDESAFVSCNSIEFDALFESSEGKRSYKEKRLLLVLH